jgi:sugar phosphate isomerase/epimerase
MSSASFTLSAFGDEIADDLQAQVQLLRELRVGHLELRGIWGKNVVEITDDEVRSVQEICTKYGTSISGIGSPVGKSPLEAPLDAEVARLSRIFQIAEILGTRKVRVFSFYPPESGTKVPFDDYIEDAAARLDRLTALACREGFTLLMENEKDIVGDTPERCHALLSAIDSPHLRFAWDPANFIQVGVSHPMTRGWSLLGRYVAHVHVKDALLSEGTIEPAGQGDGQIGELLLALQDSGYQGHLALEPHLVAAGHSSGFSGVEGMTQAVVALRRLMARLGCLEAAN